MSCREWGRGSGLIRGVGMNLHPCQRPGLFLPLWWILIIPGIWSAIVRLIPIISIVASGIHMNGVKAESGNCGQRWRSQAERTRTGPGTNECGLGRRTGKLLFTLGKWELWLITPWLGLFLKPVACGVSVKLHYFYHSRDNLQLNLGYVQWR